MPFELVGLDFVGREGREEDMSGVDTVGWGVPGWKRVKRVFKGLRRKGSGKRKPQPAKITPPTVPGAPPAA